MKKKGFLSQKFQVVGFAVAALVGGANQSMANEGSQMGGHQPQTEHAQMWLENNPEYYDREHAEILQRYQELRFAEEYAKGEADNYLNGEYKEGFKDVSPDELQVKVSEVSQRLSKQAIEVDDAMTKLTSSLGMANFLSQNKEEFTPAAQETIDGSIKTAQDVRDKYNFTNHDVSMMLKVSNSLGGNHLTQEVEKGFKNESISSPKIENKLQELGY